MSRLQEENQQASVSRKLWIFWDTHRSINGAESLGEVFGHRKWSHFCRPWGGDSDGRNAAHDAAAHEVGPTPDAETYADDWDLWRVGDYQDLDLRRGRQGGPGRRASESATRPAVGARVCYYDLIWLASDLYHDLVSFASSLARL